MIYLNKGLRNSLHFADDQVIFGENQHDIDYMLRKLNDQYTTQIGLLNSTM